MLSSVAKVFSPLKSIEMAFVGSLRYLHIGNYLCAEPLKKKKRVDPVQEQNRIRRKAKRIEREVKRLSKQGKKLKPVEEIEGDRKLMKEEQERRRPQVVLSESEIDRRCLLMKEWARYQASVSRAEERKLRSVQSAQKAALQSLAAISPHHLYAAAIRPVGGTTIVDTKGNVEAAALSLHASGPFDTVPPGDHKLYDPPDGEKLDRTPTFEYEFELDRRFMAEAKRGKFVKISGKNQISV